MGNSLKDELARIDIISKTHNAIVDRLVPKPNDPYENMDPGEREERERTMMLSQLDSAFEELGINKKLEEIKPDIERCKRLYGLYAAPPLKDEDLDSIKKVVEFIECLDEPQ